MERPLFCFPARIDSVRGPFWVLGIGAANIGPFASLRNTRGPSSGTVFNSYEKQ